MAGPAHVRSVGVVGGFAFGRSTVVARFAVAEHLRVVDAHGRDERGR